MKTKGHNMKAKGCSMRDKRCKYEDKKMDNERVFYAKVTSKSCQGLLMLQFFMFEMFSNF